MSLLRDLIIGGIGFLVRVLINGYGFQHIPLSLHRFIIPPRYFMKSLRECDYLLHLDHPQEGVLDELLEKCPSSVVANFIAPLLSHPYLCLFVATVLQYFVYLFLRQRSPTVSFLYWFNPVSVIAPILSPITTFHQFLLSLLIQISFASYSPLLLLPPMGLLLASDSQYLPLTLSICFLSYHQQNNSDTAKKSATSLILIPLLLVILIFVIFLFSGDHFDLLLVPPQRHFQPGPGILWYLQGQMFPEYVPYFTWFVAFQPYIASLLLLFRLGEINPLATVYVSYSVNLLFSSDTNFYDLIFSFCCLLSDVSISSSMRYLPLLLFTLLLSSLLSPAMFSLWIMRGYGNPNYLFFQNVAFSLAHVFFIVEYTRSAMKQRIKRKRGVPSVVSEREGSVSAEESLSRLKIT